MTSINDVRLVGRLTKDPEFHQTTAKKDFVRLTVETERFVRVKGESRRIAQTHLVTCFNQFSIAPLREHGRAGVLVKIFGELTGGRDGMAEITVSQWNGEAAVLFVGEAKVASQASGNEDSRERNSGSAQSGATGGLGKVPQTGGGGGTAARTQIKYDDEDSEIPF